MNSEHASTAKDGQFAQSSLITTSITESQMSKKSMMLPSATTWRLSFRLAEPKTRPLILSRQTPRSTRTKEPPPHSQRLADNDEGTQRLADKDKGGRLPNILQSTAKSLVKVK